MGPINLGRFIGAAVAVAGIALSPAACRDVVTDDVVDVQSSLCDTLAACGLDRACPPVEVFFENADPVEVDQYLGLFGDLGCAEGCGAAPLCVDQKDICKPPGFTNSTCAIDAECCGSTSGAGRCDAGLCCRDLGVPCDVDEECCALDGRAVLCAQEGAVPPGQTAQRTCGGLPACGLLAERCGLGEDCCSGVCIDGSCSRLTCVGSGDKCQTGDACCEEGQTCREGICQGPPPDECSPPESNRSLCCASDGGPCAGEGDAGGLTCCDEGRCLPLPDGSSVCSFEGCTPSDALCVFDTECCQPLPPGNAACLPIAGAGGLRVCQDLDCEPDIGDPCDNNCCSGLECIDGACAQRCAAGVCHSPRQLGPPIDSAACEEQMEVAWAACSDLVCEQDAFCCCFEWDADCIETASQFPEVCL